TCPLGRCFLRDFGDEVSFSPRELGPEDTKYTNLGRDRHHDHYRVAVTLNLSTATFPPFITHFTFFIATSMSANGSPSTATRSAKYPGTTEPNSLSFPRSSAALVVAVRSACSGVMPAFTNQPSSRVFW